MRRQTQKIAVAAVGVALAVPCIILTNFAPVSVSLLTVASVCYYIVAEKAGIGYSFIAIAAAIGLSFLGGVGMAQMLNAVLFAPYAVTAFFLRRFQFGNIRHMAIRAVIIATFASLSIIPIYFLAQGLTGINIAQYFEKLHYVAITAIFAVAMIAVDIMFSQMAKTLCKRIKIGDSGRNNHGSED